MGCNNVSNIISNFDSKEERAKEILIERDDTRSRSVTSLSWIWEGGGSKPETGKGNNKKWGQKGERELTIGFKAPQRSQPGPMGPTNLNEYLHDWRKKKSQGNSSGTLGDNLEIN